MSRDAGETADPSVQEQLVDVYQGNRELNWRAVAIALGTVVVWWLVFNGPSAFGVLIGITAFGLALGRIRTAFASMRWPETEATVLESTVFTERELRDRFPGLDRQESNTSGGYVPFVRYRYSVNGETYVRVRISPFDGTISSRRRAEAITDQYPKNEYTTVRYDPEAPWRGYLQSWVRSKLLVFAALGSIVGFGIAVWAALRFPYPLVLPFGIGAIFVLLGLKQFVLGVRTRRWPDTRGRVIAKDVSRSSSGRGGTSYHPNVRYEYDVDGTTYVSSRLKASGPSFNSREKARNWLDEHTQNDTVTVHYKPGSPDQSVIQPGGALGGLLFLLIGLGVIGGMVFITTDLTLPVEQLPIDDLPINVWR